MQHATTLEVVLAHVAIHCAVTPRAIRSRDRTAPVSRARRLAMVLLAREGWSDVAIGAALGRDHTTVISGKLYVAEHEGQEAAALHARLGEGAGYVPEAGWTPEAQERAIRAEMVRLVGPTQAGHVLAYLLHDVWHRYAGHSGRAGALGLTLLAREQEVRARVCAALERVGLVAQAETVRWQTARMGR